MYFNYSYNLSLMKNNKYTKIGNPTIQDIIVIIVLTFFSSDINTVKNLYPKIPNIPPRQFKIISSISVAPILKRPWIISTNKLAININTKFTLKLLSFLSNGKYTPRGILIDNIYDILS